MIAMKLVLAAALLAGVRAGGQLTVDKSACAAKDVANMALLQEKAMTLGADCEGMCKSLGAYPNCQCPGFNGQSASSDDTRGCYTSYCQDPSAPCPNDAFTNCVNENTKVAAMLQWDKVLSTVDTRFTLLMQETRASKGRLATSCAKKDAGALALIQMKAANMGEDCEAMCKRLGAYPECACPGFNGQPASSDDTRACYTKYCQDPRQPCPNEPFNNCVDATTEVSALQWKAVMGHASMRLDSLLQMARNVKGTKGAKVDSVPQPAMPTAGNGQPVKR